MNQGLFEKVQTSYWTLKVADRNHELLRYFSFQEGKLSLFTSVDLAVEFSEKFGPKTNIFEWRGISYQGYQNYLSAITFKNYLSALKTALEDLTKTL